MTYAGLHSSAALQDDESRARRDDECISRPRLAASGRIDGVAAAGLHAPAARHDDERIDAVRSSAGLQALKPARSSRIDLELCYSDLYQWKA